MGSDPSPMSDAGIDEEEETRQYLEEACYYLHKRGLNFQEVSKALHISHEDAVKLQQEYSRKIQQGVARENEVDKNLWEDIYHDSQGDEKITFVRDDGF